MQLDTVGKNIPEQFPDLSTGLGSMKGQYTIKLKPGAKLFTPRSILLPLRDKIQEDSERWSKWESFQKSKLQPRGVLLWL